MIIWCAECMDMGCKECERPLPEPEPPRVLALPEEPPLPEVLVLPEEPTPLLGRPAVSVARLWKTYGKDVTQRLVFAGKLSWVPSYAAAWLKMPWRVEGPR